MSQETIFNRIEQICTEFDDRAENVGILFARVELAKRCAELEAELERVKRERDAVEKKVSDKAATIISIRDDLIIKTAECDQVKNELAAARQENERLRYALQRIAQKYIWKDRGHICQSKFELESSVAIAKAALTEGVSHAANEHKDLD